jgi:hypothetical protein
MSDEKRIVFENGSTINLGGGDEKIMSIIDLPDAVRAYKDRPSMERELRELREENKRLRESLTGMACLEADEDEIEASVCDDCKETVHIARAALSKKEE